MNFVLTFVGMNLRMKKCYELQRHSSNCALMILYGIALSGANYRSGDMFRVLTLREHSSGIQQVTVDQRPV